MRSPVPARSQHPSQPLLCQQASRVNTAVGTNRLANDEFRSFTGQERYNGCNLFRCTQSSLWGMFNEHGGSLFRKMIQHVRFYETGGDAVDSNSMKCHFLCDRFCECEHGSFCGGISSIPSEPAQARH